MRIGFLAVLVIAILALAPANATEPKNPVDIREWTVPYEESRPRDPFAASAQEVWFVGQRVSYLAKLDVPSGTFSQVALPDDPGPHNLIVGSDGVVWYAGNLAGYIGRYDPKTGTIEKIAMPDEAAGDPHTLIFDDDQSHIWFTVQGGNFMGRLTVADRKVELIPSKTPNSRPYGIVTAPGGTVWVALFGTNKLASIDPKTLELSEHELPGEGTRPRRLVAASRGDIFYVDYRGGALGRLDPKTGEIKEWPLPSGAGARPYGMAIDAKDRIWLVETGPSPNLFVGFDPGAEDFFSVTPVPSGAGSIRHMHYHQPSGSVWFGTDNNTIGRALVGD